MSEDKYPSVSRYGETLHRLSGEINKPVVEYVIDVVNRNNNFHAPAVMLDWWFDVIKDPQGGKWRIAWLMDTTSAAGEGEGGWVWGVWWEPVPLTHTHYSPYEPPRQAAGTLLECTPEFSFHKVEGSELEADYMYTPRFGEVSDTGLPPELERTLIDAYMRYRSADVQYRIAEVFGTDDMYDYRVRITNRTVYNGDGPDWHTEEWGYAAGQWHGILKNPHPGYEHWSAFCPNCGY